LPHVRFRFSRPKNEKSGFRQSQKWESAGPGGPFLRAKAAGTPFSILSAQAHLTRRARAYEFSRGDSKI
jgi:hypothetical protein